MSFDDAAEVLRPRLTLVRALEKCAGNLEVISNSELLISLSNNTITIPKIKSED